MSVCDQDLENGVSQMLHAVKEHLRLRCSVLIFICCLCLEGSALQASKVLHIIPQSTMILFSMLLKQCLCQLGNVDWLFARQDTHVFDVPCSDVDSISCVVVVVVSGCHQSKMPLFILCNVRTDLCHSPLSLSCNVSLFLSYTSLQLERSSKTRSSFSNCNIRKNKIKQLYPTTETTLFNCFYFIITLLLRAAG